MTINADGMTMPWGKVFNKQYPGPWIRKFLTPAIFIIVRLIFPSRGMLG